MGYNTRCECYKISLEVYIVISIGLEQRNRNDLNMSIVVKCVSPMYQLWVKLLSENILSHFPRDHENLPRFSCPLHHFLLFTRVFFCKFKICDVTPCFPHFQTQSQLDPFQCRYPCRATKR